MNGIWIQVACLCVAALLWGAAPSASACNIYLPPNSSFSDDDLLIYGDGDPVMLPLREWREIYGMHDVVSKAGATARRMLATASIEAAKARQRAQRAAESFRMSSTTLLRRQAVSAVPEPGSGALLLAAATMAWLLRRND